MIVSIVFILIILGLLALFFGPAISDWWRDNYFLHLRLDPVAVTTSIVGVTIISLALSLTINQAALVWVGLIVFNVRGHYS